jgi:hypothetical protein
MTRKLITFALSFALTLCGLATAQNQQSWGSMALMRTGAGQGAPDVDKFIYVAYGGKGVYQYNITNCVFLASNDIAATMYSVGSYYKNVYVERESANTAILQYTNGLSGSPSSSNIIGGARAGIHADSDFIYTEGIAKYSTSPFSPVITQNHSAACFVGYGDSLYVGGTDGKLKKVSKNTIALTTQVTVSATAFYVAGGCGVDVFGGNVYAANQESTVRKYSTDTLTLLTTSPSSPQALRAVCANSAYVFAGGAGGTIYSFNASTLAPVTNVAYGAGINSMKCTETSVFVGGANTQPLKQYRCSDLVQIGTGKVVSASILGLNIGK